jgi:hypothetical protein
MKNDEWSDARQHAMKAAELDPVCPTVLFRAATCCVEMKDFIQAHTFYERGVHLLPTFERYPYLSELSRLKEKSDDKKANKTRADPFSVLPLETVIAVMRCGLNGDANFVLRCSWVSRRWREVLNHSCPELWKTWTISHKLAQSKNWDERRIAWMDRAGSDFECLSLKDLSLTAADKIASKVRQYAADVRRLEVEVRNSDVLQRIIKNTTKRYWFGREVRDLRIQGKREHNNVTGSYSATRSGAQDITCGFDLDEDKLCTVELTNISFLTNSSVYRGRGLFRDTPLQLQQSRPIDEPNIVRYPALKRLVLDSCAFDNVHAVALTEDRITRAVPQYQADVLHTTMRGAPLLEYLEVTTMSDERMSSHREEGVVLENLKTAIVPPPTYWHVNFSAANLESIAFRLASINHRGYWRPTLTEKLHLIPEIRESPISDSSICKLKSVEFICNEYDSITRLEDWLPRLTGVRVFIVRGLGATPYPPSEGTETRKHKSVAYRLVQRLRDNPAWLPALKELELERFFTPSKSILEYVETRRDMEGDAALQRLLLADCAVLSKQAKTMMKQIAPDCIIKSESYNASKEMRNYCMSDEFEFDSSNAGRQVSEEV